MTMKSYQHTSSHPKESHFWSIISATLISPRSQISIPNWSLSWMSSKEIARFLALTLLNGTIQLPIFGFMGALLQCVIQNGFGKFLILKHIGIKVKQPPEALEVIDGQSIMNHIVFKTFLTWFLNGNLQMKVMHSLKAKILIKSKF